MSSTPTNSPPSRANTSTHRTVPIGFTASSKRDSQYEDLKASLTSFDEERLKQELLERRRGAYQHPDIVSADTAGDESFGIGSSPKTSPRLSSKPSPSIEGLEMSPKLSPSIEGVEMSPKLSPSDEQNTSQLLRDLESAYAEHHLNGDGEQGEASGE